MGYDVDTNAPLASLYLKVSTGSAEFSYAEIVQLSVHKHFASHPPSMELKSLSDVMTLLVSATARRYAMLS